MTRQSYCPYMTYCACYNHTTHTHTTCNTTHARLISYARDVAAAGACCSSRIAPRRCLGCQNIQCILLYCVVYIFPHPTNLEGRVPHTKEQTKKTLRQRERSNRNASKISNHFFSAMSPPSVPFATTSPHTPPSPSIASPHTTSIILKTCSASDSFVTTRPRPPRTGRVGVSEGMGGGVRGSTLGRGLLGMVLVWVCVAATGLGRVTDPNSRGGGVRGSCRRSLASPSAVVYVVV